MNNIWHRIQPARITPRDFIGKTEIPRGRKMKYELDIETGLLILDRGSIGQPIIRRITGLFLDYMTTISIRWMCWSYVRNFLHDRRE